MKTYHWKSLDTYELQPNLIGVIKAIIGNKKHFKVWTLKWEYSKKGW